MQQVTLNIPTEKMPAYRQFLQVLDSNENSTGAVNVIKENYTNQLQTPAKFHPYYDWEFFMSELEYE